MNKRKFFNKRLLCVGLSTVLLAGSLAGCGKKKTEDDNAISQAAKGSKDYVFRSESVDIGIADEENIRDLYLVGDKVYVTAFGEKALDIYKLNYDGSDIKKASIPQDDNVGYDEITFDKDGNFYAIMNTFSWSDAEEGFYGEDIGEDGPTATFGAEEAPAEEASAEEASAEEASAEEASAEEATSSEESADDEMDKMLSSSSEDYDTFDEEEAYYLVKYDPEGNLVFQEKMDTVIDSDGDYFYCRGIVALDDGRVLVFSNKGIESFTEAGGFKLLVDTVSQGSEYRDYYFDPHYGSDKKVYVSYYKDGKEKISIFDPDSAKIGAEFPLDMNGFVDYQYLSGNGYTMYISDDDAVYGFDGSTAKLTKLLDYVDSDLTQSYAISSLVALSETEFIARISDEEYNYHLTRLIKVPASEVKDREVLTLAGYYIGYEIRSAVTKFNKESELYKIKTVDYSKFDTEEDYNAGIKQLNLDVASGNIPDILVADSNVSMGSFENKGLFLDLTSYLANDPEISEDDFLPNIMEAAKTNGKLYKIIPSFYVQTVVTKSKYLEGKNTLTFEDCRKIIDASGNGYKYSFGMQRKKDFLETGIALAGNKYIDWENKKCSFDSDSFIQFLELTKEFADEITEDDWDVYSDTYFREGKSFFDIAFISNFRNYNRYRQGLFGEDITFMGFPNNMDLNCSVIYPESSFSISAKSKNKDGAWEFVRYYLTDEYQDTIEFSFPTKKTAFDKFAESSTSKMFYMEDGKKVEYDDTTYVGDQEIVLDPLTAEQVQEMKDFIGGLSLIYTSNDSINVIIEEEASAFFSGQKTAQEVANIIQSRVSIYVNENS